MQRVGVKEFRVGVSHGWDITVILSKLTYFDYYIFSYYLKDYLRRIFLLSEFVDLGYVFSHCILKYYLDGVSVFIYFYDGLFGDYRRLVKRNKFNKFRRNTRNRFVRPFLAKVKRSYLGKSFMKKATYQKSGLLRGYVQDIVYSQGIRFLFGKNLFYGKNKFISRIWRLSLKVCGYSGVKFFRSRFMGVKSSIKSKTLKRLRAYRVYLYRLHFIGKYYSGLTGLIDGSSQKVPLIFNRTNTVVKGKRWFKQEFIRKNYMLEATQSLDKLIESRDLGKVWLFRDKNQKYFKIFLIKRIIFSGRRVSQSAKHLNLDVWISGRKVSYLRINLFTYGFNIEYLDETVFVLLNKILDKFGGVADLVLLVKQRFLFIELVKENVSLLNLGISGDKDKLFFKKLLMQLHKGNRLLSKVYYKVFVR